MSRKIVQWAALAVTAVCVVIAVWLVLGYRTRAMALERDTRQAERTKAMAEAKAEEEKRVAAEKKLAAERQKAENLKAEQEAAEKEFVVEMAKGTLKEKLFRNYILLP